MKRVQFLVLCIWFFCCFKTVLANRAIVENLEGIIEIRSSLEQKQENIQYVLNKDDIFYYLHFSDELPSVSSGDYVLIQYATLINNINGSHDVYLSAQDFTVLNKAAAFSDTFGVQQTIVFLVNFQDQPNSKPWTLDQVRETVFTDMNNMFYESSYHQTTIEGQAIGWYTLAIDTNTACTPLVDAVAKLAEAAAISDGIDLSLYKRRIFMFPRNNNCSWSGLGTVGTPGAYSKTWMNGYNITSIIGHEVGHNFGLYHARRLVCDQGSNNGICSIVDYGDSADVMGSGRATHFNAFQKDRLGWLNYQSSPPIETISTSGTYTIYPYETLDNNVKALKILKKNNPDGSKDYYYLEFRQALGYDAPLNCTNCDYTKGVLIHQGNNIKGNSSDLLDMSPADNNANKVVLLPGASFSDASAGVSFTTVSSQSTGAVVNIVFGDQPPPPPPPPPPLETELLNAVPLVNYSNIKDSESFYYINIPAGKSQLNISTSGGIGDVDLYVLYNQRPNVQNYQCRPYTAGNNESCKITNPQAGKYYVMLKGYTDYNNINLVATYSAAQ